MRKLIETSQKALIVCDNPKCDYEIPFTKDEEDRLYLHIDESCPLCGQNLLTMDDYLQHQKLIRAVNFINKWFGWITIFISKKAKETTVQVYTHNGIKIEKPTEENK